MKEIYVTVRTVEMVTYEVEVEDNFDIASDDAQSELQEMFFMGCNFPVISGDIKDWEIVDYTDE